VDDTLFVERPSEATRRYERLSGMSIHPVGRLTEFLAAPATKIGVGAEPHEVDELSERLRAYFGRRLNIVKTWPFYLEMTNPTASKSRALELLGAQMGFVAAEVLAFGDSYNDADMLDWAGTGVGMGDAPDVVKPRPTRPARAWRRTASPVSFPGKTGFPLRNWGYRSGR